MEDDPAGRRDVGVGGVGCSGGRDWGRYCENCHVGRIVGDDVVISAISEGVRAYALDADAAQALWRKSEEMVGEYFR